MDLDDSETEGLDERDDERADVRDDEADYEDGPRFPDRMRLDKWLWVARFYKARAMAAQAVESGKVKLNGERVKATRDIRLGDKLEIAIGDLEWELVVRGLELLGGPAPERARTL